MEKREETRFWDLNGYKGTLSKTISSITYPNVNKHFKKCKTANACSLGFAADLTGELQ